MTLKKRLIDARVTPNFDAHRFSTLSEEFILRLLAELSDAMDYLTMQQVGSRRFIVVVVTNFIPHIHSSSIGNFVRTIFV